MKNELYVNVSDTDTNCSNSIRYIKKNKIKTTTIDLFSKIF